MKIKLYFSIKVEDCSQRATCHQKLYIALGYIVIGLKKTDQYYGNQSTPIFDYKNKRFV